MPVTKVKTSWSGGNLRFQDASGNVIFTIDSARKVTFPAGSSLDTSALTGAKGFYALPLAGARVIAANDMPAIAASGGVLAKDTDPIFERINGATDKRAWVRWAATSVVEVQVGTFVYPPDLDDTQPLTVNFLAQMSGATDVPTLTVGFWVAGANQGGATAALASTLGQKSVTVAAGAYSAYPNVATITLIPGAHATRAVWLYSAWLEYTKKTT